MQHRRTSNDEIPAIDDDKDVGAAIKALPVHEGWPFTSKTANVESIGSGGSTHGPGSVARSI